MSETRTAKPVDYQSAVTFETARRGQYTNLKYDPVFRGSGIFFALVNDAIDTRITFMNYWREKNDIERVSALVTLRDEHGGKVARDFFPISDFVYGISCRSLIEVAGGVGDFTGSVEVEIFSAEDMKFAVSALEAFYVSDDAVSFVHANQRTFNNFDDMQKHVGLNAWQAGFDVLVNDDYTGFAAVLNGPAPVQEAVAELQVYNAAGERLDVSVPIGDMPGYGMRLIRLDEIDGAAEHLGGQAGTIKLDVEMQGIFNRFLCGNLERNGERLLITHSYYDSTDHDDYIRRSELPEDEYAAFLPFTIPTGMDLDLIFYPIYAPAELRFSLELRDDKGKKIQELADIATFNSKDNAPLKIDVRAILRANKADMPSGLMILRIEPAIGEEGGLIPSRLTFGMNYRKREIGCNINASVFLNPGYGVKKRTYLWGPLMVKDGSRNHLLVPYVSKRFDAQEPADLTVKIWGREGRIAERSFTLTNGTALNLVLEEFLQQEGVSNPADAGGFLWYTLESASPNMSAYALHETEEGFVGGDHSF